MYSDTQLPTLSLIKSELVSTINAGGIAAGKIEALVFELGRTLSANELSRIDSWQKDVARNITMFTRRMLLLFSDFYTVLDGSIKSSFRTDILAIQDQTKLLSKQETSSLQDIELMLKDFRLKYSLEDHEKENLRTSTIIATPSSVKRFSHVKIARKSSVPRPDSSNRYSTSKYIEQGQSSSKDRSRFERSSHKLFSREGSVTKTPKRIVISGESPVRSMVSSGYKQFIVSSSEKRNSVRTSIRGKECDGRSSFGSIRSAGKKELNISMDSTQIAIIKQEPVEKPRIPAIRIPVPPLQERNLNRPQHKILELPTSPMKSSVQIEEISPTRIRNSFYKANGRERSPVHIVEEKQSALLKTSLQLTFKKEDSGKDASRDAILISQLAPFEEPPSTSRQADYGSGYLKRTSVQQKSRDLEKYDSDEEYFKEKSVESIRELKARITTNEYVQKKAPESHPQLLPKVPSQLNGYMTDIDQNKIYMLKGNLISVMEVHQHNGDVEPVRNIELGGAISSGFVLDTDRICFPDDETSSFKTLNIKGGLKYDFALKSNCSPSQSKILLQRFFKHDSKNPLWFKPDGSMCIFDLTGRRFIKEVDDFVPEENIPFIFSINSDLTFAACLSIPSDPNKPACLSLVDMEDQNKQRINKIRIPDDETWAGLCINGYGNDSIIAYNRKTVSGIIGYITKCNFSSLRIETLHKQSLKDPEDGSEITGFRKYQSDASIYLVGYTNSICVVLCNKEGFEIRQEFKWSNKNTVLDFAIFPGCFVPITIDPSEKLTGIVIDSSIFKVQKLELKQPLLKDIELDDESIESTFNKSCDFIIERPKITKCKLPSNLGKVTED